MTVIDILTIGSATPHPLVLADMNMLSGPRFRWPRRPAINDMERLPYQLLMNQIIAALEDGRYERGTEFIVISHLMFFAYLLGCPWLSRH